MYHYYSIFIVFASSLSKFFRFFRSFRFDSHFRIAKSVWMSIASPLPAMWTQVNCNIRNTLWRRQQQQQQQHLVDLGKWAWTNEQIRIRCVYFYIFIQQFFFLLSIFRYSFSAAVVAADGLHLFVVLHFSFFSWLSFTESFISHFFFSLRSLSVTQRCLWCARCAWILPHTHTHARESSVECDIARNQQSHNFKLHFLHLALFSLCAFSYKIFLCESPLFRCCAFDTLCHKSRNDTGRPVWTERKKSCFFCWQIQNIAKWFCCRFPGSNGAAVCVQQECISISSGNGKMTISVPKRKKEFHFDFDVLVRLCEWRYANIFIPFAPESIQIMNNRIFHCSYTDFTECRAQGPSVMWTSAKPTTE